MLTVAAAAPLAHGYEGSQSVVIGSFSSFGPVDDGRIKPDITGIGVDIFSTSDLSDDQYTTMGGTSLSSCVTGSLVLLQQHYIHIQIIRA